MLSVKRAARPVSSSGLFGGTPRSGRPASLVEHLGDRHSEAGALEPALELDPILLGQDALARVVRHGDAASTEHGQQGMRGLLGAPLVPADHPRIRPGSLHVHDELLFLGGRARLRLEHVLQVYQNLLRHGTLVRALLQGGQVRERPREQRPRGARPGDRPRGPARVRLRRPGEEAVPHGRPRRGAAARIIARRRFVSTSEEAEQAPERRSRRDPGWSRPNPPVRSEVSTMSTAYHGPLLFLALACATAPARAQAPGVPPPSPVPRMIVFTAGIELRLGDGTQRCPDEAFLRREVATELGYDPFAPGAEGVPAGRFSVVVARSPSGLLAMNDFVDATGTKRWTRTYDDRTTTRAACVSVLKGVAFQVITELTRFEDDPPPAPPSPPPTPAPPPTP